MVLRESFSSRLSPRAALLVAGLALLVLPFGLKSTDAAEQGEEEPLPPAKHTKSLPEDWPAAPAETTEEKEE